MFELFDSLDENENNRLNEIEKNFQYLNEQNSDVSSNIYDNSTTIELIEINEEKFEKGFNDVFNSKINNYLDDYSFTEK